MSEEDTYLKDNLINEQLLVKALNDKEKQEWFNNDMFDTYKLEIERLNKKIEQYENPEDMTLMFMWCDEKAKEEIERLKEEYVMLQNASDEVEEKQDKEIERLHSIIKEVREYIEEKKYNFCDDYDLRCEDGKEILEILDKENKDGER